MYLFFRISVWQAIARFCLPLYANIARKANGMSDKSTITMKDIARELGVSVSTVSRALNNSPRISPEQREKLWRLLGR